MEQNHLFFLKPRSQLPCPRMWITRGNVNRSKFFEFSFLWCNNINEKISCGYWMFLSFMCRVFKDVVILTWTEPAGHRSRLVRSPGAHAAVGPSVGRHPFPDVFQLVLLHPAHLPAHLHGPHLALWPTIGEDSMCLCLCFMSKRITNTL